VLFCEKRLKLVTVKRSERTSQSFTSVCYEVWVSEVNVNDFFESMSDDRPIFFGMRAHRRSTSTDFFGYESISTVDFDRFLGEIDGRSNIDRIFK